jgi:hypothetical protein
VTNYGRHYSSTHYTFGWVAPGTLRGCTFDRASENGWVYELGIWAGKYTPESSSNVTTRLALYDTDASKNPDDRLAYTDSFTVSATMADSSGGAAYTASISTSTGPVSTSMPIYANVRYHIAALGTVGYLAHGMQEAALISADNEQFYDRTGLSQPPPNPFGSYTASIEGHMSIWAVYEANVAPDTPTNLVPSGSINETAPTFTADFNDSNEDRGDYLNQFRIQVRRKSDGTSFWDTTLTANASEVTADAISRAYGGTTLVRGTEYEWRCQMSDYFGAWSSWTAWTSFTPANLGFVTLDSDPTGKIEDNTPDFKGRWTHQSSTTMKTVMVRILNAAGTTVLQTGANYNIADVSSSSPPGTLFTIAWADTGLSTLAWGTSYRYQIRGYDGTQWSDWSASRTFSTNAAPSVPTLVSPTNAQILTSYPLLAFTLTDTDDTTATGLIAKVRIKDSGGSVLFTRTATYNGTTSRWEYQTDGTDLATYATYRWDAYAYDGTLYSGEQTVEADATKSSEWTFQYALGPTVTVTSPTVGATITTASLPVTWTTTGQVKKRIYLYDETGATLIYDSGVVVDGTGSATIPSGYYHNDTTYQLVVWVEDSTPLSGESSAIPFTVDYVEPDAVTNFTVTPVSVGNDPNGWTTANRLTWDATTYGTDVWQRYEIERQAASGVDATLILWQRITSPVQVSVTDYTPAAATEYTYTIRQIILTGLDELESAAVSAAGTCAFGGVVLVDVSASDTLRSALRYTNERPMKRDIEETVYLPLSGAKATTVRSRTQNWETDFRAKLVSDEWSTADAKRTELEAVDAAAGTLCYRDNHKRKKFCVMPRCDITDQVPDWFEVRMALREESYEEGVDA